MAAAEPERTPPAAPRDQPWLFRTYAGHSVNTDVVEGSAEAFVAALNKAM